MTENWRIESSDSQQAVQLRPTSQCDVYNLKLDRWFILEQCLMVCARNMVHEIELWKSAAQRKRGFVPSECIPIAELKRLLRRGQWFPMRIINRQGIQSIGSTIALNINLQLCLGDPNILDVINYWIDLSMIEYRRLRYVAAIMLFSMVTELLNLTVEHHDDTNMYEKCMILIKHIWDNALLRTCRDVNIYLRAQCLKFAGKCCVLCPDKLWNQMSAMEFFHAFSHRSKTVRMQATQQLTYLLHNGILSFGSFETDEVKEIWVFIVSMSARKSRWFSQLHRLALAGLEDLLVHKDPPVIDRSASRALLRSCLEAHEPIDTVAFATKLIWYDPTDQEAFKAAIDIVPFVSGECASSIGTLGEVLGSIDSQYSSQYISTFIKEAEYISEPQLKLISGLSKHVRQHNRREVLDCLLANRKACGELLYETVDEIMVHMSGEESDGYLEVLASAALPTIRSEDPAGTLPQPEPIQENMEQERNLFDARPPYRLARSLEEALRRNSPDCLMRSASLFRLLETDPDLSLVDLQAITQVLALMYESRWNEINQNGVPLDGMSGRKVAGRPLYRALRSAEESAYDDMERDEITIIKVNLQMLETCRAIDGELHH